MSDKRTIGALSVDARLLYEHLIGVPVGGEVSYEVLTAVIKRDVQNGARAALNTARRLARREKQIVFDVVHNKGLRRLNDEEIANSGDRVLTGIRRKARRGAQTLACVNDYAKLPDNAKARHNATMAVLAMVEHTAQERNVKQIESGIAKGGVPPLAETMRLTLRAFTGGDK